MKIIRKLRERFAKSFLLKQINENIRTQKQVNIDSARTLALLYYLPDEATYKKVESIVSRLSVFNLKIRVVCYTDLKMAPHYFIPKITQDIITAKDVNWRFVPTKAFFSEFVNTEYDIMIDLSLKSYLPLQFCAALSNSGLKVGRFQENQHKLYDLMIHAGPEETIDSFTEQVIHYLRRINN